MTRVLVTRPKPDAARTAQALTEAGYEPVVLSLTQTVAVDGVGLPDVAVDAVAATSANALHFAPVSLLEPLLDLPFFAVGPRTAQIARQAGFATVREGPGDAPRLAASLPPGLRSVLYLCGRVRRPDFEAALRKSGVTPVALETYDTRECVFSSEAARKVLRDRPVDAALLYSGVAAHGFARLRDAVPGLFGAAIAFALSPRIAEAAGLDAFAPPQPNEEALLALLAARVPPRGQSRARFIGHETC
ncbi:MAG: uroporphyrinogen-III synthase [Methylobacterium mesophilicum]|nr:uroporphyrinogen-III synthase [Methylobacterium mesophilicum]